MPLRRENSNYLPELKTCQLCKRETAHYHEVYEDTAYVCDTCYGKVWNMVFNLGELISMVTHIWD